MTPSAISVARVSGLEELSEWVAQASANGADRFELWSKVRGTEQQRAHVAVHTEPFEIADELLTHVERDGRAETGHAAYAIFAYRGKEKAPSERAFVSPPPRAMITVGSYTTPSAFASGAIDQPPAPSLALSTVLATMQQMIQDVFATLQRENAHQRGLNESMMRATTGHFDALAKSYERVFGDLTGRHDAALREANEHRSQRRSAEDELAALIEKYKEIVDEKTSAATEAERRSKVTSFAAEQLKMLLPVLLAKVAGVPIDADTIGGAAVGQLLDSLTDAQKAVILGALGNEQKIALYEIFHARGQKGATAKKNGAPAPQTTSDVSATPAAPAPSPGPSAQAQAPSPPSSSASPSEATPPAAGSSGPNFTPEEDRDFERFREWLESPTHQARFEAWFQHRVGQGHVEETPAVSESLNAPANDTNGASMDTKS